MNTSRKPLDIGDQVTCPRTVRVGKVVALASGESGVLSAPKGTPRVRWSDGVEEYAPDAIRLAWLQTFCGLQLLLPHFAGPDGDLSVISLKETAAVLSRIVRFGARVQPADCLYTVAEHSVRVADCVRDLGGTVAEQWSAINHEGDEALLGFDPPAPMLALLPDLRELKHRAHSAYCKRYGLPVELPAIVKHADLVLLATEKRDLMTKQPADWRPMPDPLKVQIRWWPNPAARFVAKWRELARAVGYRGAE